MYVNEMYMYNFKKIKVNLEWKKLALTLITQIHKSTVLLNFDMIRDVDLSYVQYNREFSVGVKFSLKDRREVGTARTSYKTLKTDKENIIFLFLCD